MSRLIDADKIDFNEVFGGQSDFAKDTRGAAQSLIDAQPTVEAVPKSYAEQIRWERDVAVRQLNEIGCQFGQKMDEVKKKLEVLQWIPCSEKLPDDDTDVLICSGEFVHEAHFEDGHFSNSYGMWYKSVTHWMPLPEPYKGEQYETD